MRVKIPIRIINGLIKHLGTSNTYGAEPYTRTLLHYGPAICQRRVSRSNLTDIKFYIKLELALFFQCLMYIRHRAWTKRAHKIFIYTINYFKCDLNQTITNRSIEIISGGKNGQILLYYKQKKLNHCLYAFGPIALNETSD